MKTEAKLSPEQIKCINRMKKEAQMATAKVMEITFDTNLRNARFIEIQNVLAEKIKQVKSL